MDITTLDTVSEDEGAFVHFKDVEGNLLYDAEGETSTPVGALVAGTFSQHYRKAQKKLKDRNIRAARRNEDFDAETLDASTRELEAACILAWTFTSDGKLFPITSANWAVLVAKQPQWQEQVAAAMTDHARFFSANSTG